MIVDLLRHGELEGGIKYRGTTDDPLTASGQQAMEQIWQQLRHDVDVIITSPLSRCRHPASEWASAAGLPVIGGKSSRDVLRCLGRVNTGRD